MLSVPRLYSVSNRNINEYEAVGGMRIGRGNQKCNLVSFCPPQIPHDQNWDRKLSATVGSRRVTDTARRKHWIVKPSRTPNVLVSANQKQWNTRTAIRSLSRNSWGSGKRNSVLLNSNSGMRSVISQVLAMMDTSGASNRYDTHTTWRKTNTQLSYCCTPLAPSALNQNNGNFRLKHKNTWLSRKCTILHCISTVSWLTPCNRVLQKIIIIQFVNKFPAIYGNLCSIHCPQYPATGFCPGQVKFIVHRYILLL
jgi:hypothetical protein